MLSTRKRKDVSVADIKVQVVVFAFDCLYLNGKSLLQAPLTERRQALYSAIKVSGRQAGGGGWEAGGPREEGQRRERGGRAVEVRRVCVMAYSVTPR